MIEEFIKIKTACKKRTKKLSIAHGKITNITNMFSRSMTNRIDEWTENILMHQR